MNQKNFEVLNSGALDKLCMLISTRIQAGVKGKHTHKREIQCYNRLLRNTSKLK